MIVVTQAVPSNEHSVHVRPVDPSSSSILFEVSIYLVRHIRSFVNDPAGNTTVDPMLGLHPRWAVATFYALYGGVVVYTNVTCSTTSRHLSCSLSSGSLPDSGLRSPTSRGRPYRSRMSGASAGTSSPACARRLRRAAGAHRGAGALLAAFRVTAVMHDLRM
jgi:hypothetical protein